MIVSDISQQHLLEQMRKDFIANVSHELRTPLTVINGFVETMVDTDDKGLKPWRDSLRLVEQQAHRMQKIIEDLLLLSRLEKDYMEFNPEILDIPLLLQAIIDSAELLAREKNQKLTLDVKDVGLLGVENEIYSAFNNLVTNALRYTPENGKITLSWYKDENGSHFCVTDSGIGIDENNIMRLTERFYRVDVGRSRDSGGTGLGLAIVKHVLSRHNATLTIESKLGKGSVFCCHFPQEQVSGITE
jgi:two-component system phosphate regulon sensor histidine kinase PhoR